MRIVFLGSGEFGLNCLDALKNSQHSLELIVTQPSQPAGRGKKLKPTPVASWAKENAIDFFETSNVNSPEFIEKISLRNPDLIVVIAFGQKISKQLTELPPNGSINVHSSLLPKYRGAAPINWAIIEGEKQTGISIITLAEKMDAGDILAQAAIDIGDNETAGSLHDRLAELSAPLLVETIEKISNGTAVYTAQDHSKATLARKLKKSDGFLDFDQPAETIKNKIHGFWPWPGAKAEYVSKQTDKSTPVTFAAVKVMQISPDTSASPGTLDDNLNIVCGRGALEIISLKPAGHKLMDFKAFCNGRNTKSGDYFIKIEK